MKLEMPFEKVSKSSSSSTADPMISLRKSGSIGINSSALEEYFSDDDEYAEIYYDEDEHKVGIKPVEEDTGDAYTLSRTSSGGSLTPSAFLKTYDLIPEVTTQYEPFTQYLNGDIELVTIDLDDPLKTYGSPEKQKEENESEEDQSE